MPETFSTTPAPSDIVTRSGDVNTGFPMTSGSNMIVTEDVTKQGDAAVYNAARNRAYINGTLTYDVIPWLGDATTDSTGVATFSVVDADGNALYPSLTSKGIIAQAYGNSQYQCAKPIVSTDKKTVTVPVQLTTVALGVIKLVATASGVDVSIAIPGK